MIPPTTKTRSPRPLTLLLLLGALLGAGLAPLPRALALADEVADTTDAAAVAARITDMGMNDSHASAILDALVNGIGPRLTGSSALTEAGVWAVERFTEMGLDARLESWGEVAVGFDRGPSSGRVIPPPAAVDADVNETDADDAGADADADAADATDADAGGDTARDGGGMGGMGGGGNRNRDDAPMSIDPIDADGTLTFITRAWSPGTDGAVRGRLVHADFDLDLIRAADDAERAAEVTRQLDALGDLAGTWLLTPRAARTMRALRNPLQDAVRERGAHGLVYRGRDNGLLVMSGSMDITMDEIPDTVWIELVAEQHDALVARADAGDAMELEFDIDNRFVEGPIVQYNVVADLRGSELPDEYVIVGGHLDSWDGAAGTNDNGTGSATTLEAARLLTASGAQPKRTIRFMLWGGEEQGLRGSRAYVEAHPELMEHISAVLVHDGGTNAAVGIGVTAAMMEQAQEAFAPVLEFANTREDAFGFEISQVPGIAASGGSDHVSFINKGVPGFFWQQEGETTYTYVWHTQHDWYEGARDDYQRHTSVVTALGALGIANLPEKLSRKRMTVQTRRLGVYMADDRVTVSGVVPAGLAAVHGVETGDKLLSIDGVVLAGGDMRELRGLLSAGQGRKLVAWQRGEDLRNAIFEWEPRDYDEDGELVQLTTSDGVTIHGDYLMGRTKQPASGSAIVLLHMNRSDRSAWAPIRDELFEAGIATLAIDLRGHGESVDAAGDLERRSLDRDAELYNAMQHDADAAVTWLQTKRYDPSRIGLMGGSVGCSVALRTAARDKRLAGIVLLTPGTDYLGVDSNADVATWDFRPALFVSSEEEADRGARPLFDALNSGLGGKGQLQILDATDVHGTHMFGQVDGIEAHLADWWSAALR